MLYRGKSITFGTVRDAREEPSKPVSLIPEDVFYYSKDKFLFPRGYLLDFITHHNSLMANINFLRLGLGTRV